ncbi:heat shock 70 kDa protein 12A-like [Pelmatolapia mariae]|uniref:heat shock 70 kDa protein 12A-like n=1 Tax=Pelmatolapia mariae TaxID=158779 RepID=UPI002FE55047
MSDYIIAIDFGTAYSGYVFNLTPKLDPYLRRWGKELGLDTAKTPTCVLFSEDEEFLKFGYEAKQEYIRMRAEEAKKHYFFENFKMTLYDNKLNRDVMIKGANGKSMRAFVVFSEALRYLKEDALKIIAEKTEGRKFIASDFTWVLTVPAIWDSSAKQFMREAAIQAGIVTEETQHNLIIALEPEAASVWCKQLQADGFITQNHHGGSLDQSPGTQFMVVDCGGGTIDITVHEVLDGGALRELHKASGNDLGGQTVDRKFKEFLREIFSGGVWDEYEANSPTEVQKMMYEFVYFKQVDDDVQMSCPFNLGTLAQKNQEIEKFFESVQGASWDEGAIRISRERLRSFFAESLEGIKNSLGVILEKDLNIEYIMLVGGYAESQILRQHVIEQFSDQCKVLCPFWPQEAILRGAVMFGKSLGLVASRKSPFTYGVSVIESFDESKHKKEKKIIADAGEFCCDIFKKVVEEGEDVGWNETRQHILFPAEPFQMRATITFYCSESKDPKYVDDVGVKKVASFDVRMPATSGGMNRKVKLEIKFGFTEITATGTDLVSGLKQSVTIDFMSKAQRSVKTIQNTVVEEMKDRMPSTWITVSGVPPFIPNAALKQELKRFGRFASGFRTVSLGLLGEAAVDTVGAVPPARGETALSKEDAAPSVRGEVGFSPAEAAALVWSEVSDCMTTTKSKERVEAGPAVSTAQNGDEMGSSELGVECVVASGEGGVQEQQSRTPAGCYGIEGG